MIARLVDERATIYAEPHRAAATVTELAQGDELEISGQTWIEARDSDGNSGFMPSATRLEGATPTARANAAVAVARRNMLVGGLWCGGGLLVTLFTYIAASGGGTYVVAWGAIIFGGWQLLKGISQYMASGN